MLKLQPFQIVAAYALAFLIWLAFAVWEVESSRPQPFETQSASHNDAKEAETQIRESLWQRTLTDPVAFFTMWLVIFTGLLVLYNRRLFVATKTLVTGAEDTAKRQLRAYVTIGDVKIVDPDTANPRAIVQASNTGETPAYELTMWATARGFNPKDERVFPPPEPMPILSKIALGRGPIISKEIDLRTLINPGTLIGLRGRTHILCVYGEINYTDALKESRYTKFRFFIGGPEGWPADNRMMASSDDNEAN
jgi:hypothetical protein